MSEPEGEGQVVHMKKECHCKNHTKKFVSNNFNSDNAFGMSRTAAPVDPKKLTAGARWLENDVHGSDFGSVSRISAKF